MYQPTLGRFTARDPIPENGVLVGGIPQSSYWYADNNPINYFDPSGGFPQAIIPTGGVGCPPGCDCKLQQAKFTPCARGATDIPVDTTGTKKFPVMGRPERWFKPAGLHEPSSFVKKVYRESSDGCCEYDLNLEIRHYRCERQDGPFNPGDGAKVGLQPCPGRDPNRGDPWNFALTSAIWVQITNNTCGPDESYVQFCKLVIGVHEHTLNDCMGIKNGTTFEPDDWSNTNNVVSQLCDLRTKLPAGGKTSGCP